MGPILDVPADLAHMHRKSDPSPTHHMYSSQYKHLEYRHQILERASQASKNMFERLPMRDTGRTRVYELASGLVYEAEESMLTFRRLSMQ